MAEDIAELFGGRDGGGLEIWVPTTGGVIQRLFGCFIQLHNSYLMRYKNAPVPHGQYMSHSMDTRYHKSLSLTALNALSLHFGPPEP